MHQSVSLSAIDRAPRRSAVNLHALRRRLYTTSGCLANWRSLSLNLCHRRRRCRGRRHRLLHRRRRCRGRGGSGLLLLGSRGRNSCGRHCRCRGCCRGSRRGRWCRHRGSGSAHKGRVAGGGAARGSGGGWGGGVHGRCCCCGGLLLNGGLHGKDGETEQHLQTASLWCMGRPEAWADGCWHGRKQRREVKLSGRSPREEALPEQSTLVRHTECAFSPPVDNLTSLSGPPCVHADSVMVAVQQPARSVQHADSSGIRCTTSTASLRHQQEKPTHTGLTGAAGSELWFCSSRAAFTSSFSSSPTCGAKDVTTALDGSV